jgi:hypothetical protein
MTHAALSPLIGSEFDEFLGASIGEDRNGMGLTILSAVARLNVDPWREATSLARMPRNAAVVRLKALIDALPREPAIDISAGTIAPPRPDADRHGVERVRDHAIHRLPSLSHFVGWARIRCESGGTSQRKRLNEYAAPMRSQWETHRPTNCV